MIKTLFYTCFCINSLQAFAQDDLFSLQIKLVREQTLAKHIQPRPIDDIFSQQFYTLYLNTLDEQHVFFTTTDYKTLEPYNKLIDADWNKVTTNFFAFSSALYKTKLIAAKKMIFDACTKPFDFTLSDLYNYNDTAIVATDKQLANRWYQLLKLETLHGLMSMAANSWETKKTISKTEVLAKEPEMRAKAKAKYSSRLDNFLLNDTDFIQQLKTIYLNSFLLCFDPHSAFLDIAAQQKFNTDLQTEGYFFGLSLDEDERGIPYISHLTPGGAAWNSGALNKGDVPVQLKWEGGTPVDLTGLDADDVSALLDLHTKEKLELTVRKVNGQQQMVVLQKQKQENEGNIVKSFLLNGKQRIGYINLPSFYGNWEDKNGSRCAADVGKEIMKLKKDSIAGVILDLRFNGGGSIAEAVEMAGIFIDEGIVCQSRTKEAKLDAYKDVARGVMYNGPLLILVNGQSASASELLAAALQDYHRAIIVGSTTYGKATGQQIFPLQDDAYANADKVGFIKLTGMKIYRPTGKTAQQIGVQPDIVLPDVFKDAEKEKDEKFVLSSDTVAAYKYFKPLKPLPIASLASQSQARVLASNRFTEIQTLEHLLADKHRQEKESLKWDDAEKRIKQRNTALTENLLTQKTTLFLVRHNAADQKFLTTIHSSDELNGLWLQRLLSDVQLEEAFQILSDYIQIQ